MYVAYVAAVYTLGISCFLVFRIAWYFAFLCVLYCSVFRVFWCVVFLGFFVSWFSWFLVFVNCDMFQIIICVVGVQIAPCTLSKKR